MYQLHNMWLVILCKQTYLSETDFLKNTEIRLLLCIQETMRHTSPMRSIGKITSILWTVNRFLSEAEITKNNGNKVQATNNEL